MNLIHHELIHLVKDLATRSLGRLDVRQMWAEEDRIKFRLGNGRAGDIELLVNLDAVQEPIGPKEEIHH